MTTKILAYAAFMLVGITSSSFCISGIGENTKEISDDMAVAWHHRMDAYNRILYMDGRW